MALRFRHHIVDLDLPPGMYGQTALADVDGDGRLEYITGQRGGTIYWYKPVAPDHWVRHVLGESSPSDVGGIALDVDGDGHVDFVTGGAWYRNSRDPDVPFERLVFDSQLGSVHDVVAGDLDGDGRAEVITMSDQNTLRWYKIPDDPASPWGRTDIGSPVHAGAAVGDVDGDGHLDVVRTDVWFRNVRGDGSAWVEEAIGPNTPPPPDFRPSFAFDATYAVVCDMDGDGKMDIVFTDAEIPGGKVWWMENVRGDGRTWRRHEIAGGFSDVGGRRVRRGAYHSLHVGDMDGDGDLDVVSCEMEAVGGEGPPRYYVWENVDGVGGAWREHVILDANLGGHALVVGDLTGNGLPDIVAKPWRPRPDNAVGGRMFVLFLENVSG
ncbi:MAG: VCBS repeat-containing protein [Gemmatimonadota bacterium]